jgi:hypothetical protein
MERLTNKREADAQRKEYERRLANGYPRNIPEERFLRLAAYEDTHMMPSDVTSMRMDMAIIAALFDGVDVDRMKELTEADKDGRLVVLPCKMGQRVFALLDTNTHISECEVKQIGMGNKIGFIGLEPIGARGREYGVSLNGFGKTVFLTREEVEKALEAMKDG